MDKKKVMFITNYFGDGGAARVMKVIAEQMAKQNNYEVHICSFKDNEKKYEIPENIQYVSLKTKMKKKPLMKVERIFLLRKLLKENQNCTIISFEYFVNMQTIVANLFLKNKLIISERNDPKIKGNKGIIKYLRNLLYLFSNCLVCQTLEAKEYFSKTIQKKTVIIPNPIMPNLPQTCETKRKKEIVNFCRLDKQKNLPMLIDAFDIVHKKYPEYQLSIYGDGKEKENLINYIKEKKLQENVKLYGFTNHIHSKIVNSMMFVSSSDYEGISNSMIEAMGMGIPTIVTDCPCGGARMMVKNQKNGILVPVRNTQKLVEAMLKVIEDEEFREKISQEAIKIKEELEQNKICKIWMELI